jgi:hypothetical protein
LTASASLAVASAPARAEAPSPPAKASDAKPSETKAASKPGDANSATTASGQPSPEELAAARELWSRGLELERAKDWAGALSTFEKVGKVRMTPQVRYHIGLASEQLGKLVDALNAYQLAVQEARLAGDKGRDVSENAPARIEVLRGRVAKIRLHIVGRLRTSTLLLDGKKLSPALLEQDIPVDPGKHLVEVRRGDVVFEKSVLELDEGASESMDLRVDDPATSPVSALTMEASASASESDEGPMRWPAYLTAGAGVAILAAGGTFWALREGTIATIRESCAGADTGCDPTLRSEEDLGRTYTTAGRVLFGVGGAALAAGIVLWIVPPGGSGSSSAGARPQSSVGVSFGPGGVLVRGGF